MIFGLGLSLNLAPLLSDFGTLLELSELPFPHFKSGDISNYFAGYGEHYSGNGGYKTPSYIVAARQMAVITSHPFRIWAHCMTELPLPGCPLCAGCMLVPSQILPSLPCSSQQHHTARSRWDRWPWCSCPCFQALPAAAVGL